MCCIPDFVVVEENTLVVRKYTASYLKVKDVMAAEDGWKSKSDTVISCEPRWRLCGSFLYCSCSCSASLQWRLLKKRLEWGWLIGAPIHGWGLSGCEPFSSVMSWAPLVGKSPVSGFSGVCFLRSVIRRHFQFSSWLGMSEPNRRIWLGMGWAVEGACLCILSAVHTVPLFSLAGPPSAVLESSSFLASFCHLMGLGRTEEGNEIWESKCSLYSFFN